MDMKKVVSLVLVAMLALAALSAMAETTDTDGVELCYEPYEETIQMSKGISRTGTESFPEGDSFTNNVFTRYVKEQLNVEIVAEWEVDPANYDQKIALSIASGDLPDVMVVDRTIFQQLLENDLIQPLTDVYETYISPFVKQQYDSYPDSLFEACSYEGELYGLPGTNLGYAHNVLWIRTDWLENLGLEAPETLDEVMEIARAFVEQDPDGNGEDDTIGFTCPDTLYTGYNSNYGLDTIFSYFGSYPGYWVYDDEGKAVYGSVMESTKDALAFIAEMYAEGLLDPQFAVRTGDDRNELLANGKCGICFGVWWPNGGITTAAENFETCDWIAVSAPVDESGKLKIVENDLVENIVVVSKDYEYPEAVVKVLNAQNDAIRGNGNGVEAYEEYEEAQIGWGTMPLSINIDYYNAIELILQDINDAIAAGGDPAAMTRTKGFEVDMQQALADMENPKADIAAYLSHRARITGPTAALDDNMELIPASFYGTTESMGLMWTNLEKLQSETFLKIVMGEASIDTFDTFVEDWYAQGGDIITEEVQEVVDSH